MRASYLDVVLEPFICRLGSTSRQRVLLAQSLSAEIGVNCQQVFPRPASHPVQSWANLQEFLLAVDWQTFYTSLELSYRLLHDNGFSARYSKILNDFFEKGYVAWRMGNGVLERVLPSDFVAAERQLEEDSRLSNSAKTHLLKARKFLDARPTDAANVVKESISALEVLPVRGPTRQLSATHSRFGKSPKLQSRGGSLQH
jgi:hypothetical protein